MMEIRVQKKHHKRIRRLNLPAIDEALKGIERHWREIDDELERLQLGRRDTPFKPIVRERMMTAYEYVDYLLAKEIKPFSDEGIPDLLALNTRVHYGIDEQLKQEFKKARDATFAKFSRQVVPLTKWYRQHEDDHPLKRAAEIYVGVLGAPQLFIEGNHRTGTLISSWINLYHGYPPFVLSVENAIAYFVPSTEIKNFTHKTEWTGRMQLPKYRKSFRRFWENHINEKYCLS
jgi:hypothetical protein